MLRNAGDKLSFSAIVESKFIVNPSYFRRADFQINVPEDHPQLVRDALGEINTEELLMSAHAGGGVLSPAPKDTMSTVPVRRKLLKVIGRPEPHSRTVVHGAGFHVPPFFIGEGNLDFLCGQCRATLATSVWDVAISNLVVECPVCRSHNEFEALPSGDYEVLQLTEGNFNFSNHVRLRRGVRIQGK